MNRRLVVRLVLVVVMVPAVSAFSSLGQELYTVSQDYVQRVTDFQEAAPQQLYARPDRIASVTVHDDKLYWSEKIPYGLYRANLDGTNPELILSDVGPFFNLVVSGVPAMLYWNDNDNIYRAGLDGLGVETVILGTNIITDFVVHTPSERIYWFYHLAGTIMRADLDGQNIEDITPAGLPVGLPFISYGLLTISVDSLYFYSDHYHDYFIYRTDLDGSFWEVATGVGNDAWPVASIDYDAGAGMLYWSGLGYGTPYKGVFRAFPGSTIAERVASKKVGDHIAIEFAVRTIGEKTQLFWTDASAIYTKPLSARQKLAEVTHDPFAIRTVFEAHDSVGWVYWSEAQGLRDFPLIAPGTGAMYRVDSNGANRQTVLDSLTSIAGFDVDKENGLLYWADCLQGALFRATLDGDNVTELVSISPLAPMGVSLDAVNGILYWTSINILDSKGRITAYDLGTQERSTIISNLNSPTGIAVDGTRGMVYFTDQQGIQCIRTDGTEKTLLHSAHSPNNITLDEDGQRLYYMRSNRLNSLDLTTDMYEQGPAVGGYAAAMRTLPHSFVILGQPKVAVGAHVILRANIPMPLVGAVTYQWYKDGAMLPSANIDEYVIASVAPEDAGVYQLMVTDESKGVYVSAPFELTVLDALSIANTALLALGAAVFILLAAYRLRRRGCQG